MRVRRPLGRSSFLPRGQTSRCAPGRFVDRWQTPTSKLNRLLPWRCFTVDGHGRALGRTAWRGKREQPQAIPDSR